MSTLNLTKDDVHTLTAGAFAGKEFEPFVGRMISQEALSRAIRNGLVEAGPSCRPAVGRIGYRLTAEGWAHYRRQADPHRAAGLLKQPERECVWAG